MTTCALCGSEMEERTTYRDGNLVTRYKCPSCTHGYIIGKPGEQFEQTQPQLERC